MPFIPDNQIQKTGFIPDKKTLGGFGENVGKSAFNVLENTATGLVNVLNPNLDKNTIVNLGRLAESVIEAVLPGEQVNEQLAQQLGQYFANRYGSLDKFQNTFYNDPVGVLDDVSIFLTAGGGAISKVGKLSGMSKLASTGSKIARFGTNIDPLIGSAKLAGKGISKVGGIAGKPLNLFQKTLSSEAKYAPTRGLGKNRLTENLLNQIKKTGMSTDEFFDKYKLWNRDIDEVEKVLSNVLKEYKNVAYNSGQEFNVSDLVKKFDDEIERLKPMAQQSDSARLQLETIMSKKQAFLNSLVKDGAVKLNQNIGKIAESKSYVGQDIPDSMWNMGAVSRGRALGAKKTYGLYKGFLDTNTEGKTAKLGATISSLENYKDLLKKAEAGKSGNKQISFQKLIAPTAGGIAGGFLGAAGGFAAQQLANSPTGLKAYSKVTKKASELKLPKFKPPKSNKYTKNTYNLLRTNRLFERVK